MSLPQEQGVISGPELCHDLESCNQVSCYNTGGHTVIQFVQIGVGERKTHLLECQVGDYLHRDLDGSLMEKGREEGVLKRLLNKTKILPNYWGDMLDKFPLILEGLL